MNNLPKLKDGYKLGNSPFPFDLGEIPDETIVKICAGLVYEMVIGRKDIDGNVWQNIFAKAIGGTSLDSPVGIADVMKGKAGWSLKTIKRKNTPSAGTEVRIIVGRCSPDYSFNIENPREDIQTTGDAVLQIMNGRIRIWMEEYHPEVRECVLVRRNDLSEFCIYEKRIAQFETERFEWKLNKNNNLIGIDRVTNKKCFVWQPHGSQLTMIEQIPKRRIVFSVKKPNPLDKEEVLRSICFSKDWVEIKRTY